MGEQIFSIPNSFLFAFMLKCISPFKKSFALKRLAVARLVTSHFMNGVVDCVDKIFFCAIMGNIEEATATEREDKDNAEPRKHEKKCFTYHVR